MRAFKSVGGEPFLAARAEGPYLWDVEGKRYVDYVGSWGPMVAGHSHPAVVAVYELGFAPDGTPYYTMEYVPGTPADKALARGILLLAG